MDQSIKAVFWLHRLKKLSSPSGDFLRVLMGLTYASGGTADGDTAFSFSSSSTALAPCVLLTAICRAPVGFARPPWILVEQVQELLCLRQPAKRKHKRS